jgi:hypothetical protein
VEQPTVAHPLDAQAQAQPVGRVHASLLWGLLLHSLLWALPSGLKLAGYTRVASWPWWQVTLALWVPWLVVLVLVLAGWLILKLQKLAH